MASLDDFFAKRDKKKSGKKFTTTDEIAKKIEESSKKAEARAKKERPKVAEDGVVAEAGTETAAEEWKDFVEREKDYTGLKIQKLNIQDSEDEPDGVEGEGAEGDAPVAKNAWNVVLRNADEDEEVEAAPAKEAPVKQERPAAPAAPAEPAVEVKKNAYIPPALRRQMAAAGAPAARRAPAQRGRPKTAPDINSEEYFPALSKMS